MSSAKRSLAVAASLVLAANGFMSSAQAQQQYSRDVLGSPTIPGPISVYDNWASMTSFPITFPLTQALSMSELDNVLRLKKSRRSF